MKIVIQDKTSFQYLNSDGEWIDDPTKARNFLRIQSAAEFCRKHNLRKVYIVSGELKEEAKRFNAASKTILDIAQLRPQAPEIGDGGSLPA